MAEPVKVSEASMLPEGGADYRMQNGAWVHRSARLGEGVVLEPGALVGADVVLGRGSRLGPGAVIYGPATLGEENVLWPGAVLGGAPQDIGYRGEPTRLEIGDRNVFREHVTISRGSPKGTGLTRLGSDNYLMAGAHLGHDVVVEDRCVVANSALIGGHCRVGSGANISGGVGIVQFTTIGRNIFLGGLCGVRQDLEPFLLHDRLMTDITVRPFGVNKIGLRRAGFSREAIQSLTVAYKVLFVREEGRRDLGEARAEIERRGAITPEVEELLDFIERKKNGRYGRQAGR